MDILSFSEEFSRLIIRYTKANSPNNAELRNVPLTKQEITNAVDNVLVAILGVDEPKIDIPLVETPTTGITIVTPTAPIVPKIEQEQNDAGNRFRLLDSHPKGQGLVSLDSPSQADKCETNECLQVLQDGKKFISRSSPAICITSIGRSDTYVREDQEEAAKSVSQDNLDKICTSAEMKDKFLLLLNEMRQSVVSIVTKLDYLKKMTFPHSNIVRRLSSNLSGPDRTSCRTLVPPKVRRSSTALAGTPTSSKSLTMETEEDLADRRKSISGAAITNSRKLSELTKSRSVSSSNLSVLNNTVSKPAKNPRYAHVQSTIPKPIATKRKV